MAVVRSLDAWRALERATALSTLIRQRHLTPSCGGHAPTAERTVGPARIGLENLTSRPGIREQHRSFGDSRTEATMSAYCREAGVLGTMRGCPRMTQSGRM